MLRWRILDTELNVGRIHFIGGEKGGVGKSWTARLLAQYFIDSEKAFIGFDSDQSHGTFSRFYSEFTSPLKVEEYYSLDRIVEAAEENPNSDIIVDLAAQTSTRLGQWIDESDIFGLLSDMGYEVFLWHVMDDGADSIQLLDKLLDRYSAQALQFIVVRNKGRGDNFDHFEQSPTYLKAQARNAQLLTLSKLQSQLTKKIDFSDLSFWAAANNREAATTAERQRMKVWLKGSYDQFDRFLKTENENLAEFA